MVTELLGNTTSLCPICLCTIPASRVVEGENVYLEKSCSVHGNCRVLIWRDAELYRDWGHGEDTPGPEKRLTNVDRGCPYDCGLCPNHEAHTCTVLMEVTRSCDINCPVCFASANEGLNFEPNLQLIGEMYRTIIDAGGPHPVQLSGGEPTLREDLPDIVTLGKEMGFDHIQIDTHGLRLANDRPYLERLKESGADLVYLQFDGVSDDVYRYTRGANLFELKLQAVKNCAEVKIGVILVPTIIPTVNDHQMGDIVQFAKKWIPVVKGIHFQPISYFGRYSKSPNNDDRITIPDVLKGLEFQTAGELRITNFEPRRRKDSHCGFSAFFVLMEDGELLPTTSFKHRQSMIAGSGCPKGSPSEHVRRFIRQRARFVERESERGEVNSDSWQNFFRRAETHYLSISGMPFQDAWTIDLERLQGCCIHVVTPDKRLIPFCAYYLTSTGGERLQKKR